MIKAVFDTNLLVSAFFSRSSPGGVSSELLRFVSAGAIELHLSAAILDEVVETYPLASARKKPTVTRRRRSGSTARI